MPPQGKQAGTYMNDQVILQRRPLSNFERWTATYEFLESIEDPDGLLVCTGHRYQVEENHFWVCFDRCDLPGSPGHEYAEWSSAQLAETFVESLPDVLKTCSLLRDAPLRPEMFDLVPSKGQANRRYSSGFIREVARSFSVRIEVPDPGPMTIVNSHGDALLKNMVLTANGYRLIDWEDAGPAPLGADLAHATAWLMLRLSPAEWPEPVLGTETEIVKWIGCGQRQWRLLLFWFLIGEVSFWRRGRDLDRICRDSAEFLFG